MGVYHYERPSGSTAWIAAWYELTADGSRKKRSAQFTYGTGISRYASSDDAMLAAIGKRKEEEERCYCVLGEREERYVNK